MALFTSLRTFVHGRSLQAAASVAVAQALAALAATSPSLPFSPATFSLATFATSAIASTAPATPSTPPAPAKAPLTTPSPVPQVGRSIELDRTGEQCC